MDTATRDTVTRIDLAAAALADASAARRGRRGAPARRYGAAPVPGRILLAIALGTSAAAPAAAETWVVDASCPDAALDPTDAAPPFCTIDRAALAAGPGDMVSVLPGVYREQVNPPASGSPESPISFVAAGDGVRILGTIDVSDPGAWSPTSTSAWSRSYVPDPNQVFLDGERLAAAPGALATTPDSWFYDGAADVLYVDVGGANPGEGHVIEAGALSHAFRVLGVSHLVVEGFEIEGQNINGVLVSASGEIVVRNNTVSDSGTRGIHVESATGPVTIEGNDVSFANGIGIRVFQSSGVTIQGNVSHANANHGIGLFESSGNTIVGNLVHSNEVPGGVSAVGVDLSTASSNNVVRANTALDNQDSGFELDGASNDNLLVRNVSFRNGDHGFDVRACAGTRLVSNTSQGNGGDGFSVESGSSDTQLANNIAADNGLLRGRFDLFVGNPPGTFASDYDLIWRSGPGHPVRFGPTSYATVAEFHAATGHELHGIQADPLFFDVGAGDLRVQLGPAIDSADAGVVDFSPEDHDGVLPFDVPEVENTGAGDPPFADRGAFEFVPEPWSVACQVAGVAVAAGIARRFARGRAAPSRGATEWTFVDAPGLGKDR